jgi:aldose 1-epimerase
MPVVLAMVIITPGFAQLPVRKNFQKSVDGQQTDLLLLKNRKGTNVAITNFGARIVSIIVNDKDGKPVDIAVGFNSIDDYLNAKGSRSYGAVMGRYANRIGDGRFELDGKNYQLEKNNNGNNIHGGPKGFNERIWKVVKANNKKIKLAYFSADGEMGFPGNLQVSVTYSLDRQNRLSIQYEAETDKKTIINLTNHSFFNLNGDGNILNHEVFIDAAYFTPVTDRMVPTGEIKPVDNQLFDFRKPVSLAGRIDKDDPQLAIAGGGFDHNFVLTKPRKIPQLAAWAYSPLTGILMKTYTTEPGIQFFTGNGFKGLDKGKNGKPIDKYAGLCFETQHYPDSPNHPDFPSTVLLPGKKFKSFTSYQFEIR